MLHRDNQYVDELVKCLVWFLFASRPLTLEELYYAILLGDECASVGELGVWNDSQRNASNSTLNNSKGLAEITEGARDGSIHPRFCLGLPAQGASFLVQIELARLKEWISGER